MTCPQPKQEALSHAIEYLSADAGVWAILAREPLLDNDFPDTSDIDLMVVAEVNELLPERLHLTSLPDSTPRIDVIRLPERMLDECDELARMGLVPHRLLSSGIVHDKTGQLEDQLDALRRKMYEPQIQAERIKGFLEMGFYTVREIGVTWDFPALALFWLHVGHAACLAAMSDGAHRSCPNVYTRPLNYCRELEELYGMELVHPFIEALHLDVDPNSLIPALRRIHATVAQRFPEPDWPANMRHATRYEYRYFACQEELNWRISVAEEMARRGHCPEAVFYLRFWAYSLARLPMVYHRAQEGVDVSFMRPERAVLAELKRHCPEILDNLRDILGPPQLSVADVSLSLDMLYENRERTLTFLQSCGVQLPDLRKWQPAVRHATPSSQKFATFPSHKGEK